MSFGLLGRTAVALVGRATSASAVAPAIENPYRTGALPVRWFRGNLHAASLRGTGHDLPRALRDFYRAQQYAFLGISDANTYTWTEEYQAKTLTAVPEVAATYPFGTVLAVGIDHWQPAQTPQQAVDWIRQDGGLSVLAAPLAEASPSARGVLALHGLFGIEVYDARLAAVAPSGADATSLWDQLLTHGSHVFAVAGDDLETLSDPATRARAWIQVMAPADDLASLLAALEQGAFYASTGPAFASIRLDGTTIHVSTGADATIRFVGRGGHTLATVEGTEASYRIRGGEGYVRVELLSSDGRAWSQPFWITG